LGFLFYAYGPRPNHACEDIFNVLGQKSTDTKLTRRKNTRNSSLTVKRREPT
jgi:hypothetical protein